MVRTIVTPDHAKIELAIPESYIGKKIEVLIYTVDEVQEKSKSTIVKLAESKKEFVPKKPSEFKKILSDKTVDEFQSYLKESRKEWQQRI